MTKSEACCLVFSTGVPSELKTFQKTLADHEIISSVGSVDEFPALLISSRQALNQLVTTDDGKEVGELMQRWQRQIREKSPKPNGNLVILSTADFSPGLEKFRDAELQVASNSVKLRKPTNHSIQQSASERVAESVGRSRLETSRTIERIETFVEVVQNYGKETTLALATLFIAISGGIMIKGVLNWANSAESQRDRGARIASDPMNEDLGTKSKPPILKVQGAGLQANK